MSEKIFNKYDTLKLAARKMRVENKVLMKPRGFDIKIHASKGSYWKEGKLLIRITAPSWFKWCGDYSWELTPSSEKLTKTITNRIVNLIIEITNDNTEPVAWDVGVGNDPKTIERGIEFDFRFNGN